MRSNQLWMLTIMVLGLLLKSAAGPGRVRPNGTGRRPSDHPGARCRRHPLADDVGRPVCRADSQRAGSCRRRARVALTTAGGMNRSPTPIRRRSVGCRRACEPHVHAPPTVSSALRSTAAHSAWASITTTSHPPACSTCSRRRSRSRDEAASARRRSSRPRSSAAAPAWRSNHTHPRSATARRRLSWGSIRKCSTSGLERSRDTLKVARKASSAPSFACAHGSIPARSIHDQS